MLWEEQFPNMTSLPLHADAKQIPLELRLDGFTNSLSTLLTFWQDNSLLYRDILFIVGYLAHCWPIPTTSQ